jgi:hypothetical protein
MERSLCGVCGVGHCSQVCANADRGCTPCTGWNKVQKDMQAGGPNAPVPYTPPPAAPGGWGGGRGPNIPGNGDFLAKVQAGAKNLK